jgi:type I restriction enzyme M protein
VLDMPGGTFQGAGVKTVVLFFKKGSPTRNIWYYQLNLDRNLGKTNSLNENDLAEFINLQMTYKDSVNSWSVKIADVDLISYDLSVKNPNKKVDAILHEPLEILEKIKELDEESSVILNSISELL